jgi:hypothetical membrane protein
MSPWFAWGENALSDLGHPMHPSAPVFNGALVASGVLNLVFVGILAGHLAATRLGRASVGLLAAGGISLAAVGVFDESYGGLHLLVSITYFTFVAAGILFVGLAVREAATAFSRASVVAGAVSGAFGLLVAAAVEYGAPFTSQAVPELIASLIFASWTGWVGWMLWRACFPSPVARADEPDP